MCMYQNIEGKIWVELKSRTEGNLYSIEAQRLGLRIIPLYYNFLKVSLKHRFLMSIFVHAGNRDSHRKNGRGKKTREKKNEAHN